MGKRTNNSHWTLDPSEVAESGSFSHACQGKARHSRAEDLSGYTMVLKHVPTGLQVTGEIEYGHYSKQDMRRRKSQLYKVLFQLLENLVAKKLRVPGR